MWLDENEASVKRCPRKFGTDKFEDTVWGYCDGSSCMVWVNEIDIHFSGSLKEPVKYTGKGRCGLVNI